MSLLFTAAVMACAVSGTPGLESTLIFPPEKMHNHSASIVETPDGDLLAVWFHGRGEKSDDTLVLQGARRPKGAATWSAPFVVADNPGLPDQNPVVFIDPDGVLYLWWISSLANTRETYFLQYRTASDYDGEGAPKWARSGFITIPPPNLAAAMDAMADTVDAKFGAAFDSEKKYRERLIHGQRMARFDETYIDDWDEPVIGRLAHMLSWMPRCQPTMLQDGRLALGLYSDVYMTSLACFTADGGATWTYGEPMPDYGLIQPAFLQRKDGTLVAYGRDKGPLKKIRAAESSDAGQTWTKFYDLPIDNPDSSLSAIVLASGRWLMIANDLTGQDGRHGRSRLVALLSEDEGATWPWKRAIEDSTAPPEFKPHASYPTAIQARDGDIHVVYTYTPVEGECIKHITLSEDWIRAAE